MWSQPQKNPSKPGDDQYAKFINKHRELRNVIGGEFTVNLEMAQKELAKIEQVIQIIEDHQRKPFDDLEERLKKAMEYGKLVERLSEEKQREEVAKKNLQRLPLPLEEIKLLSSIFGHEDGGMQYLSQEDFLAKLESLLTSKNERDQKIVAKLGPEGGAVVQSLISNVKEGLVKTPWDEMKGILAKGVKNLADYNDCSQIYNETLSLQRKLDAEIEQLSGEKPSPSSMEHLKQRKAAISKYIQELEAINNVERKYFTALTTTTGRKITTLERDLKALDVTIKQCKKDIKEDKKHEKSAKFGIMRLEGLELSQKVLSSLAKKGKLEQAIQEIDDALASSQNVKPFDDLLKRLDKESSKQEDHKVLVMPDSPLRSQKEDKQRKFEQNQREIAKLMASLDAIKIEGKIITKEEREKWEKIEKKIDKLMYENDALKPDSPRVNEEVIYNLKQSMRMTLALSEGKDKKTKERATSYFKNIKQTIKEMREEDEKIERDDSYSLK
ncbi:hypothetical protein [Legionella sp. WA2022007384]